jgi:hypothetical protein
LSVDAVDRGMTEADRIRVRYAPGSDDVGEALRAESFEQFLRRSRKGRVAVGDEWAAVINDGCGRTKDVTLRIKTVEGGTAVGSETSFEFRAETED